MLILNVEGDVLKITPFTITERYKEITFLNKQLTPYNVARLTENLEAITEVKQFRLKWEDLIVASCDYNLFFFHRTMWATISNMFQNRSRIRATVPRNPLPPKVKNSSHLSWSLILP